MPNDKDLLIKRSESVSKCRHGNTFYIKNFKKNLK